VEEGEAGRSEVSAGLVTDRNARWSRRDFLRVVKLRYPLRQNGDDAVDFWRSAEKDLLHPGVVVTQRF